MRDKIIDEAKARLFVDYTTGLTAQKAEFLEALLLGQVAGGMTLAQLRQALALAATGEDPGEEPRRPAGFSWEDDPAGPHGGPIPAGYTGHLNLTVPLTTLLGMSDRPGDLGTTFGAIDPDLARDLAAAAARAADSRWCVTVTDDLGHPLGHGCARTGREHDPPGSGFGFKARGQPGPAGGYGTWQLTVPGRGDFTVAVQPLGGECDHRFKGAGHDPGVLLRHLTEILHPACTAAGCRRPAGQCDYEHNTPFEAGGRTCLCNGDPKCRHDHRRKQDPRWNVEQTGRGTLRWTAPSGRVRESLRTRYPI